MLTAALLALLGSLIGVVVVSPFGGFTLGRDADDEAAETRQAQVDFGAGQLLGVAAAVGWHAGIVVGVVAGAVAAALAWSFVPRSRAVRHGLVVLVPAMLGGAIAAAFAVAAGA